MRSGPGIGLLIILLTVGLIATYLYLNTHNLNPLNRTLISVKGDIGGEKVGFFSDLEVQSLFKKHNLQVNTRKNGSISMVREPSTDKDFLSPSNKFAVEMFSNSGHTYKKVDTLFYSPLVVYSWRSLLSDSIKAGFVYQQAGIYILDLQKLITIIEAGKTWTDIGSSELPGRISIFSTDPNRSNSGNMFAGVVVNTMLGGQVATDSDLNPQLLSRINAFFAKMGFMSTSSEDIFKNFLATGRGAFPFVVGYENQLKEYVLENPQNKDFINKEVVILYMKPTVWADHEFIALTDSGQKLLDVLVTDQKFKDVAWEKHGFRNIGTTFDAANMPISNMASEILYTSNLPRASVMDKIMSTLNQVR